MRDGRYLLGQIPFDVSNPATGDVWGLPGSHVEAGEEPVEALNRELWEELGVEVEVGELLYRGVVVYPGGCEEYLVLWCGGWGCVRAW